jgi:hypothetical protein
MRGRDLLQRRYSLSQQHRCQPKSSERTEAPRIERFFELSSAYNPPIGRIIRQSTYSPL